MIKFVLFFLVYGLIMAVTGLYIMQEPGFAHFEYGTTSVDIKLINFFIMAVIGLPVLYGIIRLISFIFHLPGKIMQASHQKRKAAALHSMEDALESELKLDWEKSIGHIRKHIHSSPAPRLQHALAAMITGQASKKQLREEHIEALKKLDWKGADLLELNALIEDRKYEKIIRRLSEKASPSVAEQIALATAYRETNQLKELVACVYQLSKQEDSSGQIHSVVVSGLHYLLDHYTEESDADMLVKLWSYHSNLIQAEPSLLVKHVRALRIARQDTKAEQIIASALASSWCNQLITEYGLLSLSNTEQRIQQVEGWLTDHKDSAELLLTLGRLCKQAKLWGKAKDYLNSSLSRRPLSAAFAELAEIHEFLQEDEDAYRCAKKGIHLANRKNH